MSAAPNETPNRLIASLTCDIASIMLCVWRGMGPGRYGKGPKMTNETELFRLVRRRYGWAVLDKSTNRLRATFSLKINARHDMLRRDAIHRTGAAMLAQKQEG